MPAHNAPLQAFLEESHVRGMDVWMPEAKRPASETASARWHEPLAGLKGRTGRVSQVDADDLGHGQGRLGEIRVDEICSR